MRWWLALCALGLLPASAFADAASADELPPCQFETAEPASLYEMAAEPESWFDRCVRVEGFATSNVFYADVAGYYRAASRNERDRRNQGWLGLYFADGDQRANEFRHAEIVGRLESCERSSERAMADAPEGTIIMPIGYCHYTGGLILHSARAQYGPAAHLTRQTGDANRVSFGDLVPETETDSTPSSAKGMVAEFLRALSEGDEVRARNFVEPYDEITSEMDEREYDAFLMGEGESPFREVREAGRDVQTAFFSDTLPQEVLEWRDEPDWFACFCRQPDCSGEWPISHFDATAAPGRPYVCLRYHMPASYWFGGHEITFGPTLGTERRLSGLAEGPNDEPDSPALN
ncbi:MAG: hypothetical protein H7X93_05010 [Sphingomonadaceae bacterium]|nr:hypothetical protein [Sphingomonadaceae bacterium]